MDCEDFREALSARLDNEEGADDAEQPTDAHLDYCGDCAFWYDAAALITRRTRTTVAVAWPDVTDAVLARVPPGGDRALPRLRLGLGAIGVLQCGTGLVTLATAANGYETGAWQLALGVAFGTVAARRTPSAALVPLLGTLIAVLGWGQLTGTNPTGMLSLVLAVVGLALVLLLGRMPPTHRGPAPPKSSASHLSRPDTEDEEDCDVTYLSVRVAEWAKTA